MALTYRQATADDLDEVMTLIRAAIADMDARGIHQWDAVYPAREHLAEDIRLGELTIGEQEGRMAVIYTVNDCCDAAYAAAAWQCGGPYRVIHRLCVHPALQHRGIARQTMLHIEQTQPKAVRCLRLDVFTQNPQALRLYAGLGYRRTGGAVWRMGTFDLMEKAIR